MRYINEIGFGKCKNKKGDVSKNHPVVIGRKNVELKFVLCFIPRSLQ
jgi:hypothetical protein